VRPAVFLDRDGTIIDDVGYLDTVERVTFYPWAMDALRLLKRAGFALVVVTNQSGVARGLFTARFVEEVHAHMSAELRRGGVEIDAYHYCPHYADATEAAYRLDCDCRKPRPGMVERAARELDLDLARSAVVGDRWSDVALGRAVGAAGLLVRTGAGTREEAHPADGIRADAILDTLVEAASWILRERR
jgi:D-glycero-D-manno-heptose 1,7-bisphosphate phosphatase